MIVLGIDPGSRITGWGLVEHQGSRTAYLASGALRLPTKGEFAARLVHLSTAVGELAQSHRPDHCALEQIFTARNARSALTLGHARGVILAAVAARGIPVHEYTPTQVKHAVVGAGRAGKEQVARMVAVLLGLRGPLQEDEADALAVAITHTAFSNLAGRLA